MRIETNIAPRHFWWLLGFTILCFVLGVWGVYDLIQIPKQEQLFERYTAAQQEFHELEQKPALTDAERRDFEGLDEWMGSFEDPPEKPDTWDWLAQLLYVSLLLCVPYMLWMLIKTKKQRYVLEEDGSVEVGDGAPWSKDEIADIDMSKWMAKSVAFLVHRDGTRVKLDAYHHQNLDKIIGALAHDMYPEEWSEDARPMERVRAEAAEAAAAAAAGDAHADDHGSEPGGDVEEPAESGNDRSG